MFFQMANRFDIPISNIKFEMYNNFIKFKLFKGLGNSLSLKLNLEKLEY